MMNAARPWLALPALVLLGTACGPPTDATTAGGDAREVTIDSCGRDVKFDRTPQSVLAVGSEAPSLLVAAGAGDTLTHYAGSREVPFEEETKEIVDSAELVIEDSHELSFEMIVNSGVDTVIGTDITSGIDIDALADRLDRAGIQLITVSGYCAGIDGGTTDGATGYDLIYRDVESYGRLFDTEDTAEQSVQAMKDRVAAVTEEMDKRDGDSAVSLYVPTEGVLGAYGGEALASEQLELLGLKNVFADVDERYFEPSTESLVGAEPDVVFGLYLPTGSSGLETDDEVVAALRDRPELDGIPALDNGSVLPLNYYYTSAGPLAVDGLELLADRLTES